LVRGEEAGNTGVAVGVAAKDEDAGKVVFRVEAFLAVRT